MSTESNNQNTDGSTSDSSQVLSNGITSLIASDSYSTINQISTASRPAGDAILDGPIRVPGTYPPEWLPDHVANSCMTCGTPFTIIKRRHHCRSCGKIFCGECCNLKAKLLYLDNKEARVCKNCHCLIEYTLSSTDVIDNTTINSSQPSEQSIPPVSDDRGQMSSSQPRVQGVLKTGNHTHRANSSDATNSTSQEQPTSKQVIFSDGIRPGTDLTEQQPPHQVPSSSLSTSSSSVTCPDDTPPVSLLTRQHRGPEASLTKKSKSRSLDSSSTKNITVCDEIGYLPPIVISKESPISRSDDENTSNSTNQFTNLIISQFKSSLWKKTIQASMESRSCPLNGVVKFENISGLVGIDNVVTFLLLKGFYLKVKLTTKNCCIDRKHTEDIMLDHLGKQENVLESNGLNSSDSSEVCLPTDALQFWCFMSDGLRRFGQEEVLLVIDKDPNDPCIPRDVFKIYLTLHELALRRQSLENLGNLLFQDGLFESRDTAGLLFVRPLTTHCLENLFCPDDKTFLVALVLQRWEVPWSKVFPMRLLLRLGYKYGVYPYPIVSFRTREPVYYEVGHTIISILGDFRNFRYSMTHVDGLKVMLDKTVGKVTVQLCQSNYQQFNKVLDSSNNEHVLAWSSCPFDDANGHLVSVQTDDGEYETVEFFKNATNGHTPKMDSTKSILAASFIIFSGALKVNQSGQPAKISIVEDGLLVQIQSCTMAALKSAIHFMHHFDIDCENTQDVLNKLEIIWMSDEH